MVAKLTLVGNLGMEPEQRFTADGKPVVKFRVASSYRKRVAETREWVDATNWYGVTLFGRLAERMAEQITGRLTKGTRVVVFGRLEAGAYMDRGNQPQPSLDVVADDLLFMDSRPRGEGDFNQGDYENAAPAGPAARPQQAQSRPQHQDEPADLEDLPF